MIYGMIFLEHPLFSQQKQHDAIYEFAKRIGWNIDSFLLYSETPNLEIIKPGDSVVFYAWNCVAKSRPQLMKNIGYFIENKIYFYSVTSDYCADKQFDFKQLARAFGLYEDIRFNFISGKNIGAVNARVARGGLGGRRKGSKNKTHVWDDYESQILSMYKSGVSMYSIARQLNLTAPAVKRCLVANNVKG